MKVLLAVAVLAASTINAPAKPSHFASKAVIAAVDDDALYLGPVGAMRESDYFRVPEPPAGAARIFPCRVRLHVIGRTPRFAQVCD
jgi:hypothetical protein